MRHYTRTGDAGATSLASGERVPKHCVRLEACGSVDELNSCMGWARAAVKDRRALAILLRIQLELFELGADLATPLGAKARARRAKPALVSSLERDVDSFGKELKDLRHFVVPGGCEAAARLHLCRAVARRAERRVSALADSEGANPEALRYLNRLSSLLFVLARWLNARAKVKEEPWRPRD